MELTFRSYGEGDQRLENGVSCAFVGCIGSQCGPWQLSRAELRPMGSLRRQGCRREQGQVPKEQCVPFEKSKLELRSYVSDWNNRQAEVLIRAEAAAHLRKLISALDPASREAIDMDHTMAANGKIHVHCLIIQVQPTKTWDVRGEMVAVLAQEDFFARGKQLKRGTDCPPWQVPLKSCRQGSECFCHDWHGEDFDQERLS